MKVLFLDFDGVLNSQKYLRLNGGDGVSIDPSRMTLLRQIVLECDAKIVLSTSWREHWEIESAECSETGKKINEIFEKAGLEIQDKTPTLRRREEEIEAWLREHPDTENFVVLDDGFLYSEMLVDHIVKTSDYFGGLDESDVQKAIEILKG